MSDINNLNETPDYTESFHPEDVQANRVMGILAYLGILVLIPLFAAKESPFARFHCNQGIVLLIAEVVVSAAYNILKHLPIVGFVFGIIASLASIGLFVLSIIGIVNAARGRAKELPLIGGFQIIK